MSAPSYAFSADTTTGFYRIGTGTIGIAVSGAQAASIGPSGVTWSGTQTFNGNLTINGTTTTFGAGAVAGFLTGLALNFTIGVIIDGEGSAVTTGQKGYVEVPCNCTIKRSTLLADQSGSAVVAVWKTNYAGFPPASGNSIVASAPPTLSSQQNAQDSTLSGWTTSLNAGDILAYNVNSASTVQRLTLSLLCQKTGA